MTPLAADAPGKIGQVRGLYHRLVLAVGVPGSGKTAALREIAVRVGAPVVNADLELSRRLIDLAGWRRQLRVQPLLDRIVAGFAGEVVLLDNTELLFDAGLRRNPLGLLQRLSRRRTVAASWSGSVEDGRVRYAAPGHPEYRRYPLDGVPAALAEAAR